MNRSPARSKLNQHGCQSVNPADSVLAGSGVRLLQIISDPLLTDLQKFLKTVYLMHFFLWTWLDPEADR